MKGEKSIQRKTLAYREEMTMVKRENAISVIFVFDLRKGGTLIFTWKRSFWMRLQINTHLSMMRLINQEVQKCCANTIYLTLRC